MGERTLHVLDVENLAGTGDLTDTLVAELAHAYIATVPVGVTDHVVPGCAHHLSLVTSALVGERQGCDLG